MTAAGKQRELARYQLPEGTRAVVAQRIDGRVAISDVPVDHADRVYLIERDVTTQAELSGLVAAYVEHSQKAGCPAVIAQRRQLDELANADAEDAGADAIRAAQTAPTESRRRFSAPQRSRTLPVPCG